MKHYRKNTGLPRSWDKIISGLMVNNRGVFFTALYHAMMEHPGYVILSDMPFERKQDILKLMVKHYEFYEDYEKCANITAMQKQLIKHIC
tara:strand:+ start:2198 stop:2467 length:270 start_codon:yes stop_codon:yes gene_type:complete